MGTYTRLPHGQDTYGIETFIIDTVQDLALLPTDGKPGNRAIVTDDGLEYILNNKHQWVIKSSGSGSGGGEGMTQTQINQAVESILATKNYVTTADLEELTTPSQKIDELETQLNEQIEINNTQAAQLENLGTYDASQADRILVVSSTGKIEAKDISSTTGIVTSTTSGLTTYEVSNYTGRGEDLSYLYECTAQQWQSFNIKDGETVQFVWNRLRYTVQVTQSGDDFILGDTTGSDPYVIFTHRQDLGVNKLIAKVYQPVASMVRDTAFKVITGVPQTTDSITLRSNGINYRLYINDNGELQVQRIG